MERFLAWIKDTGRSFIFITNNSKHTPEFISNKLKNYVLGHPAPISLEISLIFWRKGLDISSDIIYTAAMACAEFIISQKPHHCTAYCLGDVGTQSHPPPLSFSVADVNQTRNGGGTEGEWYHSHLDESRLCCRCREVIIAEPHMVFILS